MKNIFLIISMISASLLGMYPVPRLNEINYFIKSDTPERVTYTVIHNTQQPIIKWEVSKNKETNRITCREIKRYYHSATLVTLKYNRLPEEYFDLIEQRYNNVGR